MKVSEFKHQNNIIAWRALIEQYRSSGQSLREWCQQNNLTEQQYYYRLRRVKESIIEEVEKATTTVSLVKLEPKCLMAPRDFPPPVDGQKHKIVVRYGSSEAEFSENTDVCLIARLMKELAQ